MRLTQGPVLVVVSSLIALGASPVALAHDDVSTIAGHAAEDAPHGPAVEPRLERHTRLATAGDAAAAAAAVTGAEGDVGQWGPVVDWPVVGVHEALLPDGKVL